MRTRWHNYDRPDPAECLCGRSRCPTCGDPPPDDVPDDDPTDAEIERSQECQSYRWGGVK
jgi:hypothetical protein